MKPITIDPKLFSRDRERLRKLLPKNALVVVNANDPMPTNAHGTTGFHQRRTRSSGSCGESRSPLDHGCLRR